MNLKSALALLVVVSLNTSPTSSMSQTAFAPGKGALTRTPPKKDVKDASHSQLGEAFNQGPRQQPKLVSGLGNVHFPITTKSAEAQKFFNQGMNLLYSFFWFEAERAFRQVAFLDPDCAMAYWGMAMCDNSRGKEFIKLAVERKPKASRKEQLYIDALEINFKDGLSYEKRVADNIQALEKVILEFPDDIEAKAIYAWALKAKRFDGGISNRLAIDALLKEVLAKNPNHPGAHHYRIHLWDGSEEAGKALDSSRAFPKAAPAIGHAQHMPGHIYAQLGMWEDAAFAMDAAARAERKYFYDQRRMTWDSWNYSHDTDYLIANLGYTGRIREGIANAKELIYQPRDPDYNTGGGGSIAGLGRFGLMRMWVRGELWDEVLKDATLISDDTNSGKAWKAYALALAHLGTSNLTAALAEVKTFNDQNIGGDVGSCAKMELNGRIMIAEGKVNEGLAELKKATDLETSRFRFSDPPPYPRPLYESYGYALIQVSRYDEAIATLQAGLSREGGNGFALALLLEAQLRGNKSDVTATYEKLKTAFKYADPELPILRRLATLTKQITHPEVNSSDFLSFLKPFPRIGALEKNGPSRWQPWQAPEALLKATNGKTLRLSDFKGKNVLLVFYLGGKCEPCLKQLETFGKEKDTFKSLDTELVAVCADSLADLKQVEAKSEQYPFRFFTDEKYVAAAKFNAYDEFESLPLHASILINRKGQVWWFRSGSNPFTNVEFLKREIPRMEAWLKR